jgi:hypothetical protein
MELNSGHQDSLAREQRITLPLFCIPCDLDFQTTEEEQAHFLSAPNSIHPKCEMCDLGFKDAEACNAVCQIFYSIELSPHLYVEFKAWQRGARPVSGDSKTFLNEC